jgi:hypothetical protein
MPYIPFTPAAPVTFAAGSVTGYTNGFFYSPNYNLELNLIAKEINALQYQFSGTAALTDVGSAAASMSAAAGNIGIVAKNTGTIVDLMTKISANILTIANKIEMSSAAISNVSSHMAEQVVVSQMAYVDQSQANKHQQLTVEAAQEQAGLPKTVVTTESITTTLQQTAQNVSIAKASAKAASLVDEAITSAFSYAKTTTTNLLATYGITQWIKNTYAETEILVVGLFSKEKAEKLKNDLEIAKNNAKSGNPG